MAHKPQIQKYRLKVSRLSMNDAQSKKTPPISAAPNTPATPNENLRLRSIKSRIRPHPLHQFPDTKNPLIERYPARPAALDARVLVNGVGPALGRADHR
jgi:hypothetical protein